MSRKLFAVVATLAVAMAVVASTASGGSATPTKQSAKNYKFILVAGIASAAFYLTMNKGAQAEAKKLGASVQFTGSPEAFSPPTQIPFLTAAIAKKPDAILIAPTDKSALIAPIQRAIDAGIPVITVDTFITKNIAVTNVSTDNLAGGRAAADALVKAIGGSGGVAGHGVHPRLSPTDTR